MKKSKFYILGVLLLIIMTWCIPVIAEETNTTQTSTTSTETAATVNTESATATSDQSTSGIKPITPEKLQSKITILENEMVKGLAPIMHLMSKLALILVGFLLLAAIFVRDLFSKVFVWVGCIVVGLLLFGNVGPITDTIQYVGQWLGQ